MRVLWFTNNSSCYSDDSSSSGRGGGWISSLELELKKKDGIELGVCFYHGRKGNPRKEHKNSVDYYLLPRPAKSPGYMLRQILGNSQRSSEEHEKMAIPPLLEVVEDFKPDVIHVFGSESIFGLLAYHTPVPVVLHIQGLLTPCLNAFLPPSVSWRVYLFTSWRVKRIVQRFSDKLAWERNSLSEQRMLKKIKYLMGRTEWDYMATKVINPNAVYFHCDEMLRDAFYAGGSRQLPDKAVFVTTLSAFLYKGLDVVLKTAKILKQVGFEFEWRVYGYVELKIAEKISGVTPEQVNVELMNLATAEQLREAMLHATAYVHTSYIENSPNALCEAQLLGCACIATNVGGVSSLIEHGQTGLLVPANDIYALAYQMMRLSSDTALNRELATKAKKVATSRHDKQVIANRVVEIYRDILNAKV